MVRTPAERTLSVLEAGLNDQRSLSRAAADVARAIRAAPIEELRSLTDGVSGLCIQHPEHDGLRLLVDVLDAAVREAQAEAEDAQRSRVLDRPTFASVMSRLADGDGQTTSELSSFLKRGAPQISRVLKALKNLELVESWASEGDKRSQIHRLSIRGREILRRRSGLSPSARAATLAVLDLFEQLRATGRVYLEEFRSATSRRYGELSPHQVRELATMVGAEAKERQMAEEAMGVLMLRVPDVSAELDRCIEARKLPAVLQEYLESLPQGVECLVIRAEQRTRDRWQQLAEGLAESVPFEVEVIVEIDASIDAEVRPNKGYCLLYDSPYVARKDSETPVFKGLQDHAIEKLVMSDDGSAVQRAVA